MKYYDNTVMDRGKVKQYGQRITEQELYDYFKSHPKMLDSFHINRAFHGSKLASGALMMALHYICNRASGRINADIFFHRVASGLDIMGRDDPAHTLRQKLISNAASKEKISSELMFAFVLKAWNAWRENKPIQSLRFRTKQNPTEKFPKALK